MLATKIRSATAAAISPAWDLANAVFEGLPNNRIAFRDQETSATDVFFKPDGTKMYILGSFGDDVNEYDLAVAWDISTASFLQSFSVISQDATPAGLFFKPDGLKMYVVGSGSDRVWEYDLTTAWNISTASVFQSISISGQETVPTGLFFKPDGLSMYIIGSTGDDINQYNLSTAWDISTAVYITTYSVSAQESAPSGLFFKPDGTRMYVVGTSGDDVNEYTLSIAWDITSATYVRNFIVQAQVNNPAGIFFKPDGTRMFIVGGVYLASYDFPIITDATYINSFDVSPQETTPLGIFFKPDGLKMYIAGSLGDDVNEYNLSTAWDITTANYIQNFSVAAQDSVPQDIYFRPDGLKMYIVGSANDFVYEYNLSIAWNISTASYLQSFNFNSFGTSPFGIFFKPDGTKMYIVDGGIDSVVEFGLSTAWDITTASFLTSLNISLQEASVSGISFDASGYFMSVIGSGDDSIDQYRLSNAWDIDSATFITTLSVSGLDATPQGLYISPDNSKIYFVGSSTDAVYRFDTAWNLSSATFVYPATNYYSVAAQATEPSGLFFKPDGSLMYVVDTTNDNIISYSLSTAWDISTASIANTFSLGGQTTDPRGVFFKPDGTEMYVIDIANDRVLQYQLNTAWDISSLIYDQAFSLAGQETNPTGVFFKTDGTKMYVTGATSDAVQEYNLSTAWEISTTVWVQSCSVVAQETQPSGVFFRPDGLKMYVIGPGSDNVNEYDLSTAWNVVTAAFVQNFNVEAQDAGPRALFFKPNGMKMYICGVDVDAVWSYDFV
jgi:DNA-binding beta-propeller fold protein YncE